MHAKQDGDILVFELEGHLDFETTLRFKETCACLIKKQNVHRVVFNFDKLRFVGSTGINQFVRVLKDLNSSKTEKPRMCNLSPEFTRIFKAYQTIRNPFHIFDDETQAIASFSAPLSKPLRRKSLDQ
ncbi:MAG: STAS domain-containing protein [Deltaproteobacteria bacterium]|nr:STAS domain-containing protein [Deltaproteobacteria bacterium]